MRKKKGSKMMHLRLLCSALFFLMTAANPVVQDTHTTSKGALWEFLYPRDSKAVDGYDDVEHNYNAKWMWKRMMGNSGPGGSAADGEAERLRARLLGQLAELRERLPAYMDPRFHSRALIWQLQRGLSTSLQELCSSLLWQRGSRSSQDPPSFQEALQSIDQAVEGAQQLMASQLEDFQIQLPTALRPAQQSVSTILGQELEAFRIGLWSRAAMLRKSLGQEPGWESRISPSVAQFCLSTETDIKELRAQLEQHLEGLQQNWRRASTLQPYTGSSSLGSEFSTKLSFLLSDIRQALD
ncbi:uncharacterized protein zgc:162608 isoform X2 [Brienomyrus brachyistius]|uniref:uncharacterized protein zgc:162608 isoform X2 n=1 Tax=Brienomyrus brachyistius TaxID=42636 RepID=UPI0020B29826|nr:uncharacterized protein zgc:162608 isoform X2 [Brienomyrus brachyistius]